MIIAPKPIRERLNPRPMTVWTYSASSHFHRLCKGSALGLSVDRGLPIDITAKKLSDIDKFVKPQLPNCLVMDFSTDSESNALAWLFQNSIALNYHKTHSLLLSDNRNLKRQLLLAGLKQFEVVREKEFLDKLLVTLTRTNRTLNPTRIRPRLIGYIKGRL